MISLRKPFLKEKVRNKKRGRALDKLNIFKMGFAVCATFLFGGWDTMITALLVFIVIDYLTGVLAAGIQGILNSSVGLKGIAKKVFILLLVALAVQIDNVYPTSGAVRDVVIYFFLANEGISILENAGKAGLPIPDRLVKAIETLGQKEG